MSGSLTRVMTSCVMQCCADNITNACLCVSLYCPTEAWVLGFLHFDIDTVMNKQYSSFIFEIRMLVHKICTDHWRAGQFGKQISLKPMVNVKQTNWWWRFYRPTRNQPSPNIMKNDIEIEELYWVLIGVLLRVATWDKWEECKQIHNGPHHNYTSIGHSGHTARHEPAHMGARRQITRC